MVPTITILSQVLQVNVASICVKMNGLFLVGALVSWVAIGWDIIREHNLIGVLTRRKHDYHSYYIKSVS